MPRLHVINAVASQSTSESVHDYSHAWLQVVEPRVPQDSVTSTTSASATTTSNPPFFPSPSPSADVEDENRDGGSNNLTKAVLEYAILAVGLALLGFAILRRIARLRRTNQPLQNFFSLSSSSSTPSSSFSARTHFPRTHGLSSVPPYSDLSPLPAAHQSRRTHALDIDEDGRRLTGTGEYVELGDKDLLPAYEGGGGPPGYADVGARVGYGYPRGVNGAVGGRSGSGEGGGDDRVGERTGVGVGTTDASTDTSHVEGTRTDSSATAGESTSGATNSTPAAPPAVLPTGNQPGGSSPNILDTASRNSA